jgi:hypothetical protein
MPIVEMKVGNHRVGTAAVRTTRVREVEVDLPSKEMSRSGVELHDFGMLARYCA